MFDDVVQDVRVNVERVVSAKVGELEDVLELMSGCPTEGSVKDESDMLKVLLAGVETRFREEHTTLVDASTYTRRRRTHRLLCLRRCGAM